MSSSKPKPLKTMEEVWKDINGDSLPGEDPHNIRNLNMNDVNLQDFLARPFAKNPQMTSIYTCPPTMHLFNLNFSPDFNFDEAANSSTTLPNVMPYEGLASNSTSKKRVTDHDDENIGDRRYKRMMKNRESATRSRARKQAYRSQLEGDIAILKAENIRLKKLLKAQLSLDLKEASPPPPPPKNTLCRTSSAPF